MKKILSIVLSLAMYVTAIPVIAEENIAEVEGLHEKLSHVIMEENFTQEQIEKMDEAYAADYAEWFWNEYLPATKKIGRMHMESDEEEYQYMYSNAKLVYTAGVRISLLSETSYTAQYAAADKFDYLFSGDEYWYVPNVNIGGQPFSMDCRLIDDLSKEFEKVYGYIAYLEEYTEFLKNEKAIEDMLIEKGEKSVTDIKVCMISDFLAIAYIKCEENEYIIKLHIKNLDGFGNSIEQYKLYTAKEFMELLTKEREHYGQEKPTYETEATALQEEGLLQGNENGLDLLKPLTRIEAATMLLRAIGEDNFTETAEEEIFTDVPVTHWGCKSAAKAYSLGLIQGIGDNLFAPDKTVTGEEFSTMVLRAAGTDEFDWQEALNILVEKGIITEENTETMDLFTRGDMAKIIYEARQNGLL